jgi:hypothetical protein
MDIQTVDWSERCETFLRSPASRLAQDESRLDPEILEWSTKYTLLLCVEGRPSPYEVECRTLSMMRGAHE